MEIEIDIDSELVVGGDSDVSELEYEVDEHL